MVLVERLEQESHPQEDRRFGEIQNLVLHLLKQLRLVMGQRLGMVLVVQA
jgi:hypothetical protein